MLVIPLFLLLGDKLLMMILHSHLLVFQQPLRRLLLLV